MAVSLVASLAAVEVLLRVLHPMPDPYAREKTALAMNWPATPYVPSAYPPHYRRTVRHDAGLPGLADRPTTFTVNNLGFRGDSLAMPKPAGELRVFVVGGSTTECLLLDDSASLTARLQAHLRALRPGADVRVYGAGKAGDRSWDHVAMVAHRIAHLQPDVIVVFMGVNDLSAAVAGRDYLLRDPPKRAGFGALVETLATRLQLGRLIAAALSHHRGDEAEIRASYHDLVDGIQRRPAAAGPPPENVPAYAENLETLAGIARGNGVRMVLMTQATTWTANDPRARRLHWMLGKTVRYREADLDAALGRYNDAMRRAGAEQGVAVFDLARWLPKSFDYIYDDVHFNPRGADAAAAMLARFMVENGVVAPAADSVR
jgi:lysophospholipase L1-like esterase